MAGVFRPCCKAPAGVVVPFIEKGNWFNVANVWGKLTPHVHNVVLSVLWWKYSHHVHAIHLVTYCWVNVQCW